MVDWRAQTLRTLIESGKGEIQDSIFVTKPGCLLIAHTALAPCSGSLFNALNIDEACPNYEQFGEFNSRLTYLSFRQGKGCSVDFNHKIARQLGHLSVYAPVSATFLLAGVALETSLELVAHHEAHVARLTSSNTQAMSDPLYRVQGTPTQVAAQMDFLRSVRGLWVRHQVRDIKRVLSPFDEAESKQTEETQKTNVEFNNMMLPGCKATALTYTMNLKDFHKL